MIERIGLQYLVRYQFNTKYTHLQNHVLQLKDVGLLTDLLALLYSQLFTCFLFLVFHFSGL